MSQTPNQPILTPPTHDGDHLASLHHMSTTAGVGSQEYVAINPWSVAAVVFGAASALALLTTMLLIIPLAGVLCGLIALPQIRYSNGTQTGRRLAWFGFILSIGFTMLTIGSLVNSYLQDKNDTRQIVSVIDQMWHHLQNGQWDQAYAFYDDRFHQTVSAEQFAQQWKVIMNSPAGRIKSIGWNGVSPRFVADPYGTTRLGFARVNIEFENQGMGQAGETLGLRRVDGQWRINSFSTVFPAKNAEEMMR